MNGTYARARLWTGILGVGAVVLIAVGALASGAVGRLFDGRGGNPGADAALLASVFATMAVLMLPFDVAGGVVLPRRHGRPAPGPGRFLAAWLRGVVVLGLVWVVVGVAVLAAGSAGGRPAAVAVVAVSALALVLMQEPLARLVGGLRRIATQPSAKGAAPGPRAIVLRASDPGFTGGFAGLGGTLVVPERWVQEFESRTLAVLLERRQRIHRSGAWRTSVLLAVLWTACGFGLASLLPGAGVETVSGLLTTALGFTLWTFLGLLLLPTPSRRATLAADASVVAGADERRRLCAAVGRLDQLQDDEPERAAGVERVFHPVPSVANRMRAIESGEAGTAGAWHLARVALYLSWAGLSLLPRAVHCNAGRPELWAYLPADG